LVRKIHIGDINAEEIYIGGKITGDPSIKDLPGINAFQGVKATVEAFKSEVKEQLQI